MSDYNRFNYTENISKVNISNKRNTEYIIFESNYDERKAYVTYYSRYL